MKKERKVEKCPMALFYIHPSMQGFMLMPEWLQGDVDGHFLFGTFPSSVTERFGLGSSLHHSKVKK